MRYVSPFVLLVIGLLSPSHAGANNGANERNTASFGTAVDVRLIEVAVNVTDRSGKPVTDLDAHDFELFVDDQPVAISHFQRPRLRSTSSPPVGLEATQSQATSPTTSPTTVLPTASRKRINLIIYLDRAFLRPGEGAGIVSEVQRLFSTLLGPGDRTMLWVADRRLDLVQGLTTLDSLIAPLLEREIAKPGRGRAFETEYRDVLAEMDRAIEEGFDIDARDPARTADRIRSRVENIAAEALFEVQRSTELVDRALASMDGLRGRTVMVYFGGRLPVAAGVSLASAWKRTFSGGAWRFQDRGADTAATSSGASSSDGLSGFDRQPSISGSFEAAKLFTRIGERAAEADIVFFVQDRSRMRRSTSEMLSNEGQTLESIGSGNWNLDATQETPSREALRNTATLSGGRLLGGEASSMTREWLESGYVLAFVPPFDDNEGGHSLEVRVPDRPHLALHHRQRVRAVDTDQELAQHVVATLRLGGDDQGLGNSLGVEVTIGEARKPQQRRISVQLPLAGIALVADAKNHKGRLSLYWAISSHPADGKHEEPKVGKAVLPVSIANRDLLTSLGRRVEYAFETDLPASAGVLAITVRDDFSASFSTVRIPYSGKAGDQDG